MNSFDQVRIIAVIVSYNPSAKNLNRLILSLTDDPRVLVNLVDNGSPEKLFSEIVNGERITKTKLESNVGIATAQNKGIEYAIQKNADFVIFFDQDSTIPAGFIDNLLQDYYGLKESGIKVGAIGPRFIDDRHDFYYKTINLSNSGFRKKMDVSNITQPIHSSLLISSGSLISVETLKNVGLMRENYFIDYVDTEWCIRAESKGYKNYMSAKAVMRHTIGDKILQFGFFNVPVHSPFRRYYRVRNAMYMLHEPHVPFLLFLREMIFNFVHQMILVCSEKEKNAYLKSYLNGIRDGFRVNSKDFLE